MSRASLSCRLALLAVLVSCRSDQGFTLLDAPVALEPVADRGDGGAFVALEAPAPAVAGSGGTVSGEEPRGEGVVREERFALGDGPTPVVDYLLVVDSSHSMRKVRARVTGALEQLARARAFPRGARVAVLNTSPGDLDDPRLPHPALRRPAEVALHPGFLRLVDAEGVERFVVEDGGPAGMGGWACGPWFAPKERSPKGKPCLLTHMLVGPSTYGAEAGLTALGQWLEAVDLDGRPQFREGAAVNIVFLSDTHDPGLGRRLADDPVAGELWEVQPTVEELRGLVNVPTASFRLHAIAPERRCSEHWEEATYFEAAAASGGLTGDICTLDDYAPLIRRIAREGARRQSPVVRLGRPVEEVLAVELDGEPVRWRREGRALRLLGPEAQLRGTLAVRYRRQGG